MRLSSPGSAAAVLSAILFGIVFRPPLPTLSQEAGWSRTVVGSSGGLTARPVAQEVPADPASTASIQGRVVNSLTGEPVRQANLTLTMQPGGLALERQGGRRPPRYVTTADAQGHFRFENLPPGDYQLEAQRSGFVNGRYGAAPGRPATPITAAAGESVTGIEFPLMPQAVIAGRVLDENGEPLANVSVRVARLAGYFQQIAGGGSGTNTNAIGEFLIGGLAPGKYVLVADYRRGRFSDSSAIALSSIESDEYLPTYYPNASEVKTAAAITLAPGQQVRGMDVWLQKGRLYRVSGQVAGLDPSAAARVNVMLRPEPPGAIGPFRVSGNSSVRADGVFVIRSVPPGAYELSGMVGGSSNTPTQMLGPVPVVVVGKDVENVTLSAVRRDPVAVSGRVRMDEAGSLGFNATIVLETMGDASGRPPAPAPVGPDGSFRIEGVPARRYSIQVRGIPDNVYVKQITAGHMDLLANSLDLTMAQALPPVEIVLSAKGGIVEGIVKDEDEPRGGAFVTLLPEPLEANTRRLQKTATTDAGGRFSLQGIAPGDYRLYAWQESFPLRIITQQDLHPYASYGVAVRVEENARRQAELRAVPLP